MRRLHHPVRPQHIDMFPYGVNSKHMATQGEQPHAGFPEANYHTNAERLARAGLRVVVVEQTETPVQLAARNEERKKKGLPKVRGRSASALPACLVEPRRWQSVPAQQCRKATSLHRGSARVHIPLKTTLGVSKACRMLVRHACLRALVNEAGQYRSL